MAHRRGSAWRTVIVIPTLSESLAIGAGVIGGPVVGLSALLLQKLFGNPFEKTFAYSYQVTGTWDNPVVARLSAPSNGNGKKPK